MTPAPANLQKMLRQLVATSDEAQVELLLKLPAPEATLLALADEAARAVFATADEGLRATETIASLADRVGAVRPRVRARMARALALAHAGQLESAVEVAEEGARMGETSGAEVDAARCRLASMHPLTKLGRLEQAIAAGEAARERLAQLNEPALAARADLNLANVQKARGNGEAAILYLDRAIQVLGDDTLLCAQIGNTRGNVLLLLDRFEEAEASHQQALRLLDGQQLSSAAAIVEANLADLHVRCGRLQSALRHFESALARLDGAADDRHRARLLVERSDAIEILGLAEEALHGYSQALEFLSVGGFVAERARALAGRGRCLLRLRRFLDALEPLTAARDTFASLGDAASAARLNILLAEALHAQGQPVEARTLLDRALTSLPSESIDRAAALTLLARTAFDEPAADHAVSIARRHSISTLLADALGARAAIRRRRRRLDLAIADLEEAVGAIESVRGTLQAERFRAAFLGGRLSIYDDLVRAILDQADPAMLARAFEVVERAKSRALLDIVRGAIDLAEVDAADDPHAQQLLSQLVRLRAELNALYSQLGDDGRPNQRRLSSVTCTDAIRAREFEVDAIESRLAGLRSPTSLFAAPAAADEVRGWLGDDRALVEFFIADDELLAFALGPEGVRVFRRLAKASDLVDLVGQVHFQMRRAIRPGLSASSVPPRMADDARRALHNLWLAILAPLSSEIDDVARLVVVPHGPLHLVPFSALHDGRRFLIERTELTLAPSASLLARSTAPAPPARRALVAAVADDAAPCIAEEGRRVAHTLASAGFDEVHALIQDSASAQRVIELSPPADVIHLACHGRFLPALPQASGLRLADRWLTVRDVYRLRLSARLVTLSGCDTGRNLVAGGDELMGLVRGFLAAGARSLLVSHWSVNDAATADFMDTFYSTWHSSDLSPTCVAAAVRQAQCEPAKAGMHPAFWASFSLVGGER
jgi:CHAT domain-containing protein/tetratricopeptide (TPR) repeat protein